MPPRGLPNSDADGLDQICWSCRQSIDHRNGLSLLSCDNTGSRQICETCWEQIPIAERIKLQWLMRARGDDGSGLVDLIDHARAIIQESRGNLPGLFGADPDDD